MFTEYLQSYKELSLIYGEDTDKAYCDGKAYCDTDYSGDSEMGKSTIGYVIQYCGVYQ